MLITFAMEKYTKELPNGENIGKLLGHVEEDGTETTKFAKAFAKAEYKWTKKLCESAFPGADKKATVGEVLGDPCCKWEPGDDPEFVVKKLAKKPKKAGTCKKEKEDKKKDKKKKKEDEEEEEEKNKDEEETEEEEEEEERRRLRSLAKKMDEEAPVKEEEAPVSTAPTSTKLLKKQHQKNLRLKRKH